MWILDFVDDFVGIVLIDTKCQQFGVIEERDAFREEFGDDAAGGEDVHRRLQGIASTRPIATS